LGLLNNNDNLFIFALPYSGTLGGCKKGMDEARKESAQIRKEALDRALAEVRRIRRGGGESTDSSLRSNV